MQLPKLDFNAPETFIAIYFAIAYSITVYPQNTHTSEYLYFYLCNLRLLLLILAMILTASVILRTYTIPTHFFVLKLILIYTALTGVYWYRGFSLSFVDAVHFLRFLLLPLIIMAIIEFVILIVLCKVLSRFFSWYDGNSKVILFFKDIHDIFKDHDSPERYRSLTCWNLDRDEKQTLKFILSLFTLILLSLSVLYLPSVLSSTSPRFYDIYAIHGDIKANMDNEYSMDKLIYVPVETGGLDAGLSVTLSKYNSGEFEEISSLILYPSESKTQKNNSLSGEPNIPGNYKVYLDPASMSTGDYELKFENAQNKNVSTNKVFALKQK